MELLKVKNKVNYKDSCWTHEFLEVLVATACFPNFSIKGCLFPFTQSKWRRTVVRGLKRQL